MTEGRSPILKYPGSKCHLAQWILSHVPAHEMYLEPYLGSGIIFLNKPLARHEIINDLDGDIVNLFRVIRDHGEELAWRIHMTPWARDEYCSTEKNMSKSTGCRSDDAIENARRFLVRCWQAHGVRTNRVSGWRHIGPGANAETVSLWRKLPSRLLATIERLLHAEIENRPALEIIEAYKKASNCVIYADPPYVRDTRNNTYYKHEMSDADHGALLDVLDRHSGPVVLSGYAHPLYDTRLAHWHRVTSQAVAEHGRRRTEVLWLNQKAAQTQQLKMFEGDESEVSA